MSDLLRLALSARIPIVKVTTDDPEHSEDLIADMSDRNVKEAAGLTGTQPHRWPSKHVVILPPGQELTTTPSYDTLLDREQTLVVINPTEGMWGNALDCGALTPGLDYLKAQLAEFLPESQVEAYGRYFVGMSLRTTIETVMLTQARDNVLTATGINETKSYLGGGLAGLEALETSQSDYVPPDWAEEWMEVEAPLLEHPQYRELWPKGFLLHGPSGTGKTELARWIARKLGWPLYRLDLGSLYSRWQGESEKNLRRVLNFISAQGECVFLLDEAEKLFGNEAVGQASLTTLLSMLLWWLQGESNRTVTVMTANNKDVIPPELYRPGRLDAVHHMVGLESEAECRAFINLIAERVAERHGLDVEQLQQETPDYMMVSQATLVAAVRAAAKRLLTKEG